MILIDEHLMDLNLTTALELLPAERRAKALRYRRDIDQRQCVAAWLLLREACRQQYGLNDVPIVAWAENGKPYFPTKPEIHFNLSHCAEAVACAIDDVPVGIDIECVAPINQELLQFVLNEEEQRQVMTSANPPIVFTTLWTQKESLLKLTGEGLSDDLKTLLSQHKDVQFHTVVAPSQRYVYTLAKKGSIA